MDTLVLKQRKNRPHGKISGAVVAEILYQKQLQQNEVAAKSGLSPSSLQKICSGKMDPSIETLSRILSFLDARHLMGRRAQENYLKEIAVAEGYDSYLQLCSDAEPVPRNDPDYLDTLAHRHGLESRAEQLKIYDDVRRQNPLNQIFSAVLEYVLEAEGIKKSDVAFYTGRDPSLVQRWVTGKSLPNEEDASVVMKVIGLGYIKMDEESLRSYERNVCEELGIESSLREFLDEKKSGKEDRLARRLGYENHEAYLKSRRASDE